jgi:glycosidase
LGDFVEFSRQARLRLIIDLPINHTSEEHPWFQAARGKISEISSKAGSKSKPSIPFL